MNVASEALERLKQAYGTSGEILFSSTYLSCKRGRISVMSVMASADLLPKCTLGFSSNQNSETKIAHDQNRAPNTG